MNEYDDLLASEGTKDEARTTLRASVIGALPTNPDQYAEAKRLARTTGVPAPVVERNMDEVKKQATLNEYDALIERAPVTASKFQNPEFAKVAHDERDQLAGLESLIASAPQPEIYGSVLTPTGRGIFSSTAQPQPTATPPALDPAKVQAEMLRRFGFKGASAIDRKIDGVLANETRAQLSPWDGKTQEFGYDDAARKGVAMVKLTWDFLADQLAGALGMDQTETRRIMADTQRYMQGLGKDFDTELAMDLARKQGGDSVVGVLGALPGAIGATDNPFDVIGKFATEQLVASSIGAGVGSVAAAPLRRSAAAYIANQAAARSVGVALTGASASSTAVVLQSLGSNYQEGLSTGLTPDEAGRRAWVKTLAEVPANALAGALVGLKIGPNQITNILAQTGVQAAAGGIGAASASVAVGEKIDPLEIALEIAGEGIGAAPDLVVSGALTPASIVSRKFQMEREAQAAAAKASADHLTRILQAAEASKTRARDPETFAQLVQDAAEASGTAPTEVFIDAQPLVDTLQKAGMTEAQIREALPSVAEQLGDEYTAGGSVAIPIGEAVAAFAGTGAEADLVRFARTTEDGYSVADSEQALAALDEMDADAQRIIAEQQDAEAWLQSAKVVEDTIFAQLDNAGRFSSDVNRTYATLLRNYYVTQADVMGITPEELYRQFPLTVSGVAPTGQVLNDSVTQITPEQAMTTNVPVEMPADPLFAEAVGNTPGAEVTENGLLLDLVRFQKPEQEGGQSIRTGVFYLPAKSADVKHYRNAKTGYGGGERFNAPTLVRRPLFVKGATGGAAPEQAYRQIKGKDAFAEMSRAVTQVITRGGNYMRPDPALKLQLIEEFLDQYAPEQSGTASLIERVSREGNTLRYALQELAVAHAVREAGYDAVVGYSKAKTGARISEVFDVREQTFPARDMESEIHDKFLGQSTFDQEVKGTTPYAADTIEVDGKTRSVVNNKGQRIAQTEEGLRNFWRWFGDSKVVDAEGRPLVVYHGTKGNFDTFDAAKQGLSDFGASGRGFYFSEDAGTSGAYAMLAPSDGAPNVMPVYLAISNPSELGALLPQNEEQSRLLTDLAKSAGHDGIVVRGADGVIDEVIAFNPTQIKSAIGNRGTYDPADPNTLHQSGYSYTDEELDFLVADGSLSPEQAASLKATAKSRGQNADARTASATGRTQQADARAGRAGEVAGRTVAGTAPRSGWEAATAVRGPDGKPARIFRGSIDGAVTPDNFNPEQFGKASGYATSGLGVFFSTWHSDAQKYADNTGGRVGSFFLDIRNPRVFTSDQLPEFDSVEQATEFREALRALGHDGIAIDYTEVKGPVQMVAFDPEQVILPGDEVLYQSGVGAQGPRLSAVHNLSAENLVFSDKMGGIAVPSIGVVTEDAGGVDGFGEITLIGTKDLADPRAEPVFSSDAYSARFPAPEWNKVKRKDADKLVEEIRPIAEEFNDRSLVDETWDGLVNSANVSNVLDKWLSSPATIAMFLREQGIDVAPVKKMDGMQSFLSPEQLRELEPVLEQANSDFLNGINDSEAETKLQDAVREAINAKHGELRPGLAKNLIAKLVPSASNLIDNDLRRVRAGDQVDTWGTRTKTRELLAEKGLELKFKGWVEDKILPLVGEPFIKIGREKRPYTLPNIVEAMTDSKVKGKEKTMTYGAGMARAAASVQFNDFEEMRAAAKTAIADPAEYENAKKESEAALDAYRNAVIPYTTYTDWRGQPDTWEALDASMRAIAKWGTGKKRDKASLRAALKREGFKVDSLPSDALDLGIAAGNALMNAPVPYFEAKPQRAVSLGEFAGAVIPANAAPEVRAILDKHGIPYREVAEGDNRQAAVRSFTRELSAQGADTLFQNQPGKAEARGSFNPTTLNIALFEKADLSTFLHETVHFFFEMQVTIAARPNAPARIVDDVNTLLKAAGFTGTAAEWLAQPLDARREAHEKVAESFEQYLITGEAPTVELQGLFNQMRAWMLAVYKTLKQFFAVNKRAGLSAEVAGVFDRMLASDAAIAETKRVRAMSPLFTSAEAAGMTAEEWAAYQADAGQMDADARRDLDARQVRDMKWLRSARGKALKALQADASAKRREARIEARRRLLQEPVYRAMQFLRGKVEQAPVEKKAKGLDTRRDDLLTAIAKLGGLNKDLVVAEWGIDPKDFAKSPVFGKPILRSGKAGLSPDGMAEALAEVGYLQPKDGDRYALSDLEAMLDDSARGIQHYSLDADYDLIHGYKTLPVAADLGEQPFAAGRLSRPDLEARFANSDVDWQKLGVGRRGMIAEVGMDADAVANIVGFNTGEEMVKALLAAESLHDATEALTDQIMLERHGDITSPEGLQRAADAALANDAHARMLATEYARLNKAVGSPRAVQLAAKEAAERTVDRQPVRLARPDKSTAAAARAGKAAARVYNTVSISGAEASARAGTVRAQIDLAVKEKRITADEGFLAKDAIKNLTVDALPDALREVVEAAQTLGEERALVAKQAAEKRAVENANATESAAQYKRIQILNTAIARAQRELRAFVDKAQGDFAKMFGKDAQLAKTRDMNLVNLARAALAQYGLAPEAGGMKALQYLDLVADYDPALAENLKSMLAAMPEGKDYRDLTAGEFRTVASLVRGMWEMSRGVKQITIDGKKVEIDAAADELVAAVLANNGGEQGTLPGYSGTTTTADDLRVGALGIKSMLTRVEQWADFMGPAFKRFIWQPVSEAVTRYRVRRNEMVKQYRDLLKVIEPDLTFHKIHAPELGLGGFTFNAGKSEVLHAILHSGNESNLRKLLLGRGWATVDEAGNLDTSRWDAFVKRMAAEGVITRADMDFVQGVWDLMETVKGDAQKAHRELYGYYFNEVTATPFVDPFGVERRGGYAPAIPDALSSPDAMQKREQEELLHAGNSFIFPSTGMGFALDRVEYNRPLELDLRLFTSHLDKVTRFTYIEPAVRDVGKLLINKRVARALNGYDQTIISQMLNPWLQRAARQTVSVPGKNRWADKFFNGLRSRSGVVIMFANVVNTLQQLTGFSVAAIKVPAPALLRATYRMVTDPKRMSAEAAALSPWLAERMAGQSFEMQQEIKNILVNPNPVVKGNEFLKHNAYFMQQAMQNMMDPIVWWGAYDNAVANGANQRDAIRAGDEAVRTTQGTFAPEDVSAFESNTAFVRLFIQFYGYFNMLANTLGAEAKKAIRDMGYGAATPRLLFIWFAGLALPAVVAEIIARGLPDDEDDEDGDGLLDEWLALFFGSQGRTLAAMAPGIGQGVSLAVNLTDDKVYNDRLSISPGMSMAETTIRGGVNLLQGEVFDERLTKAEVRDTLTLIGMATGAPTGAIARSAGYLVDVENGKADPENPVDYAIGLTTGR